MRRQSFIIILPLLLIINGCGGKNNHIAPPAPTESAAPAEAGGRSAASYVSTCQVTSNADSTATGTLRFCITFANSNPGPDTITFSAPMEIYLYSSAPDLIDNATTIVNTTSGEVIVLGGAYPAIVIKSANNVIRGLTIGHCYDYTPSEDYNSGIFINGVSATGNVIAGNYIGTNISGTRGFLQPSVSNEVGIYIKDAKNNTVGGVNAADKNVISANTNYGIVVSNSESNIIAGNYIGTNPQGTTARPNGGGILLFGSSKYNVIGGSSAGERNVISGNNGSGITIFLASYNTITGNYIGTKADSFASIPNTGSGVYMSGGGSQNNRVGGTAQGEGNIIGFNGNRGVVIESVAFWGTPTKNKISGNKIYLNTGLEIALVGSGVNQNIYPPTISSAIDVGNNHTISGWASCPNNPCVVELFGVNNTGFYTSVDPSGAGGAVNYLGSATVSATASFQFTNIYIGQGISVTGTVTDANMNTSEFAVNKSLPPANPPSVSYCAFSPSSILANGAATTRLSCNVSNPGKVIGPVTANLSSIGGSSAAAMTLFSVDQFKSVFVIDGVTSPLGTAPGAKSVVVTAQNTEGLTGSSSASLTLIDPSAPAVSGCVYNPTSLQSDNISASTLKCVVTDIENNVSTVTVNLTGLGGSSGVAMSRVTGGNYWQKTGIKVATSILPGAVSTPVTATDATGKTGAGTASLTVKEPNSKPVVGNCSFSPSSVRSNNSDSTVLSCTITDAEANISAVAANLGAIGGSTGAPMTNMGGGIWRRTNIKVPGSVASGAALITVKAVDSKSSVGTGTATLTVTPAPPSVTSCSIAPNSIPNDGTTASTLQCNASDPNNDVATVVANLSAIGGPVSVSLTNVSGNNWEKTGVTVPGSVATGQRAITVTATDSSGVSSASRSVYVSVRIPNSRPSVSGCSFSPASIRSNGIATTTLTCSVSDADGNISAVAVNLGQVGGSTGAPLANIGGGSWRRTSIKSLGIAPGSYNITVTAKDALSAYGSSTATLTIIP